MIDNFIGDLRSNIEARVETTASEEFFAAVLEYCSGTCLNM